MNAKRHAASRRSSAPLGIVSAMPEEAAGHALMEEGSGPATVAGYRFRTGLIQGHPVVMAEAGVGKVATALVGGLLLDRFGCGSLIFSGVAGGIDPALAIGDVVVADELVQHDYGAVSAGHLKPYRPGMPPLGPRRHQPLFKLEPSLSRDIAKAIAGLTLPSLPGAIHAARRPKVVMGRVLSGDQFVNCADTRDRLSREFSGQAVEMEGAALAQVAERFGVPCVVVRCLSDLAGSDSHVDFRAFLPAAAKAAAVVVERLIPVVAGR